MNKRASVIALALAGGALAFGGASPASPSSSGAGPLDAMLFAAIAAPTIVSYNGVVEVIRMGSRTAEAAVYRVEHRAPDLTRRIYTAPPALSGDIVVSKGALMFSIDTRRRRILEDRSGAADDATALDVNDALLRRNYSVAGRGGETVDGRRAIDLALVNRHSGRTTMLVRIDAATKIVLDKQEFSTAGALSSERRFEQIHYLQPPLADFALPRGYALVPGAAFEKRSGTPEQIVRSAGFAVRAPRVLPDGFAPVEAGIADLHGVRTVHLLYSDGLRTVSLFESATASTMAVGRLGRRSLRVGGRQAEYAEDGATALLSWSSAGLYYTLVGEVGSTDLVRLATAVEP